MQRLQLLPETLALVRRAPGDAVPGWFPGHGLRHATWATDELSLLCEETAVPADEPRVERGWRALRLQGPFDFALTGILLSVLEPLAAAGIGIFAVSTFDTDYVLVKAVQLEAALAALRGHGHQLDTAPAA